MDHHKPVFPLPTPAELVAFNHGAAGHQGISSNAAGDLIIKPCTQAEIDFYEAAKNYPDFVAYMPVYMGKLELGDNAVAEKLSSGPAEVPGVKEATLAQDKTVPDGGAEKKDAQAWVPSGGKKIDTGLAIVLENTTAAFRRPNVIDLKLGSRLWDDAAPEAKRQKLDQVSARTTSGSLNFRIAGAKIYVGAREDETEVEEHAEFNDDGYKCFNKLYGQGLNEQTVQKAISRFLSGPFNSASVGRDKAMFLEEGPNYLIKKLVKELKQIIAVLEKQESRMYSASVLVVIEGSWAALKEAIHEEKEAERLAATRAGSTKNDDSNGPKTGEEQEDEFDSDSSSDETAPKKVMEVRLIDFAHAKFTPGEGPDENALKGLRNIVEILNDISD